MSAKPESTSFPESNSGQLFLGLVFGVAFGFLLQKGGVAKYHVLIGVLLLEDFTVIKVMASAILVGMIGIYVMHRMGMVQYQLPSTRYAANIIGGLIFGAGFGLSGYCPGTNAAAIGQGNFDALAVAAGLIAGSWLFAEVPEKIKKKVQEWGDYGKLTLHELLDLQRGTVAVLTAIALIILLIVVEWLAPR
ncbi:hypothetical protein SAMN05660653_01729 [Desulfonatronum thiosulfatophilum]|uniref:Uncharacterized protein n=1 Tax=Desulfonatronum thiosulfatophilum TaxID=617002 RepID=A0A1G6CUL8_9BACT|nr:DUF6691 family protein [Desulfonatronum thiosulfatophilum]SDB36551.1 hypothetical protein SAMN05660653_01729 [Desulfonatronum thiosulfatophilum]